MLCLMAYSRKNSIAFCFLTCVVKYIKTNQVAGEALQAERNAIMVSTSFLIILTSVSVI